MQKKRVRRICAALMCCMLVVFVMCPVAFASSGVPIYEFEGNALLTSLDEVADENGTLISYSFEMDTDFSFCEKTGFDTVFVDFGSGYYCEPYYFTFPDEGAEIWCVGNSFLYGGIGPNNGLPFLFCLAYDASELYFVLFLEADFVKERVSLYPDDTLFYFSFCVENAPDGVTVYGPSALSSKDVTSIMTNVGTVFGSAINMVSTVATVFTSYPILYLPIVIGMCGIGIAFYKRMKQ